MNSRPDQPGSRAHIKRLSLLSVLLLVVFQITAAPSDTVERILGTDLKPLKDGMPGEEGLEKEVVLAADVKMSAVIEVTAKGNGSLRIGNLNLKVFDSHDDGSYYENGLLNIDFSDLDGN